MPSGPKDVERGASGKIHYGKEILGGCFKKKKKRKKNKLCLLRVFILYEQQVVITPDDRPVMPNHLHASISVIALVLARVPHGWEILLRRQKPERKWVDVRKRFRGMFLWGFIYQGRTGTAIRALHPDVVFGFG